jgi:two-component system, cell cycle response regulator DivK
LTTILIVDDRRDSELILGKQLQSHGFDVRTINEAAALLDILEAGGIDLILMDMNMPEVDGCEATQTLKADVRFATIPVVICTAHPLDGDEARARASGCDSFLEKPVAAEVLIALVHRLIGGERPALRTT